MLSTIPVLGALCISLCGRDKGKNYLIVKIVDHEFVLVADGVSKKVANPKKKRTKHIKILDMALSNSTIAKLATDSIVDNEIHKILLKISKPTGQQVKKATSLKEVKTCQEKIISKQKVSLAKR